MTIGQHSPSSLLDTLFETKTVLHPDGRPLRLGANISRDNSDALRRVVRKHKPSLVVEIGMAYGVSTLSILDGLRGSGGGRLISIDPYVGWPSGREVAMHHVSMAGCTEIHQHYQDVSYRVLPRLLLEGMRPDMVYIDGNHNFDHVFTDFFYADRLLDVDGVVGFNDCGWRPVFKTLKFLQRYRRYEELDVGLPRVFEGRNPLFSLVKRIEGRSSRDRYFQKSEEFEPEHGFHRAF